MTLKEFTILTEMKKRQMISAFVAGATAGTAMYIMDKNRKCQNNIKKSNSNKTKNALIVASVASMIDQFNIPNIKILLELGYNVDVAANFVKGSTCSEAKIRELIALLDDMGVDCYHVDFDRNVADIRAHIKSFKELDKVVCGLAEPINQTRHHYIEPKDGRVYAFIHSHSPIGGVVGRITGKRHGIKNIYTAHGFHFYNGAPLKDWLFFYPIEKICSRWTDVLITINKEDYQRSKKKFHVNHIEYIPGIGIDLTRFSTSKKIINREEYRKSLGIPNNAFVMVSVGELNKNKNHSIILKAMSLLQGKDIHYVIAGQGAMYDSLLEMAKAYSIEDRVHLLGFRNDVSQLYQMADVCVFPSIREGLGIAAIEGMVSGLPLICSNNRGACDFAQNGVNAFVCDYNDVYGFASAIQRLYNAPELCFKFGKVNLEEARRFDIGRVNRIMHSLYNRVE